MSDMQFFVTGDQVRAALKDLGPIGDLGEAYVKGGVEAYLHLLNGGSVNGMRLVSVDALVIEKVGGEWPEWLYEDFMITDLMLDALASAQVGGE